MILGPNLVQKRNKIDLTHPPPSSSRLIQIRRALDSHRNMRRRSQWRRCEVHKREKPSLPAQPSHEIIEGVSRSVRIALWDQRYPPSISCRNVWFWFTVYPSVAHVASILPETALRRLQLLLFGAGGSDQGKSTEHSVHRRPPQHRLYFLPEPQGHESFRPQLWKRCAGAQSHGHPFRPAVAPRRSDKPVTAQPPCARLAAAQPKA
jgi:hypothetical protein